MAAGVVINHLDAVSGVCATKTRRIFGSKAPWPNDVPAASGSSMTAL
jgi:hypothetical protein